MGGPDSRPAAPFLQEMRTPRTPSARVDPAPTDSVEA
jgi:hypothetical protein